MAIQRESAYSKKRKRIKINVTLEKANIEKIKDILSINATSSQRCQCYDERNLKRARTFVHDFLLLLKRITGSSIFYTKCPT